MGDIPDSKEGQKSLRKDSEATTLATLISARGTMQQDTQLEDVEAQTSSLQSDDERASKQQTSKLRASPRVISDAILGLSDGLTVPFALTAGLSAFGNARLVVLGGLAELIAGAISMGLGGFVGAKSEAWVQEAE
jgi:vacuolar iron transporter family protein